MTGKEENRLEKLLGKAIAKRRAALGMSQFDLAERLGIAPASLSRIENGLAAPRFSRLEEIAEILDCPVSFFGVKRKPSQIPQTPLLS